MAQKPGRGNPNYRHGQSKPKTPTYISYTEAKGRCVNEKSKDYPEYGGRGIEFRFGSFVEFFDELGERPEGCSVDRIDNSRHYEPGNVRWATPSEQAYNRRKPRRK